MEFSKTKIALLNCLDFFYSRNEVLLNPELSTFLDNIKSMFNDINSVKLMGFLKNNHMEIRDRTHRNEIDMSMNFSIGNLRSVQDSPRVQSEKSYPFKLCGNLWTFVVECRRNPHVDWNFDRKAPTKSTPSKRSGTEDPQDCQDNIAVAIRLKHFKNMENEN